MFTYNLWMGCLHPDISCQLLCPVINIAMSNNFKHSHVHFTQFFTVTKRASCFYIEINIFEHFKTKHTTKSTSVSS